MHLDLASLEFWLDGQGLLAGPRLSAEKFATGQSNPTYLLRGTAGGDLVLRRKPPGKLLQSAHAVEREYRVQRALAGTDVPVPRMIALCEDDGVIGSAFYLMEHVTGKSHDDPRLSDVSRDVRGRIMEEMSRVLAAIHALDIEAVGLADYGPRGDYFRRQIDRWSKQYRATETGALPDMDALMEVLDRRCPEDDRRASLVHGDFRLDNLLFDAGGTCVAVLDWELSTLGHPLADLAAVIMQWQMPPGGIGRGLAGVDREAIGVMGDEAFVADYCGRMGMEVPGNFGVILAFSFFRMGAILQGVKRRGLDGNASDPGRAAELGALVPRFASMGLAALEG